ncbi:phosphoribosyltransferase-like protein [Bradyrhizobium liaoningense]|uniref:phosphoribosyltransferase-like protein n=1 Tax=Bradyrhizobium liaoningense TaxID=43992 RepID=UPI001BA91007|nr:hypothetical protein [Bradyrhizobium liaoningense]MBR0706219.1 hypothetical protein [Bradyrhizobium liaoningense]
MKDKIAQELLATVMDWTDQDTVLQHSLSLQLLADYKYNHYQRYGPGQRFIESLALWLEQFDKTDRTTALEFIQKKLIFISEQEIAHLVTIAYPDVIVQERLRLVAEESQIAPFKVGQLIQHPRFERLGQKSLYLGLSDGAHTNDLRRASNGAISNEQIWQAYELGETKAEDMLAKLRKSLRKSAEAAGEPPRDNIDSERFNLVWLVDDFSGSGNTYIRFEEEDGQRRFAGKIQKIYDMVLDGGLVNPSYYEIYLLLYVATRQAIDHIEYWSERFTSERGLKPLRVRVLCPIERDASLSPATDPAVMAMLAKSGYYDDRASDSHIAIGGTKDARYGFAKCALPLVLSHNTPNNSVYALWGPEEFNFVGLFPRVSRHRTS